jgi:transcription initiation factor IIE alpha subunit
MFCYSIYRTGSWPYSDGICPECNAEIDAVDDGELAEKMKELKERYKDRRREK